MKKIDLKKELKHLYNPSAKEVVVVDVPEMNFLMIDGMGDPNDKWQKPSPNTAYIQRANFFVLRDIAFSNIVYAENIIWHSTPSPVRKEI